MSASTENYTALRFDGQDFGGQNQLSPVAVDDTYAAGLSGQGGASAPLSRFSLCPESKRVSSVVPAPGVETTACEPIASSVSVSRQAAAGLAWANESLAAESDYARRRRHLRAALGLDVVSVERSAETVGGGGGPGGSLILLNGERSSDAGWGVGGEPPSDASGGGVVPAAWFAIRVARRSARRARLLALPEPERWRCMAWLDRQDIVECGKVGHVLAHDGDGCCGAQVAVPHCCDRWNCRYCRRRWASAQQARIVPIVEGWRWPAHIVLTAANAPLGSFVSMRRSILKAFRRLREREILGRRFDSQGKKERLLWRDMVPRGFMFWGMTVDRDRGWHLHLHILADVTWIDAPDLARAWRESCAHQGLLGLHTHVGRARQRDGQPDVRGLVREGLKGTKADLQALACLFVSRENDDIYGELLAGMQGIPWLRPFGDVRAAYRQGQRSLCPRCGEPFVWRDWRNGGKMASAEIVRRAKTGARWADIFDGFVFDPADSERGGGHPRRVTVSWPRGP